MTVKIGYESLQDRAGVTVSSGTPATTNPVENAVDRLEFDFWQVDAVVMAPLIKFAHASAQACDYVAIHAHDMSALTDTFFLQYSSDDIIWSTIAGAGGVPVPDGVLFFSFAEVSAKYWRVLFNRDAGVTAFAPKVGVLSLGTVLDVGDGAQLGVVPPLTKGYKKTVSTSIDGTFLGSSIRDMAGELSLRFHMLAPAWVRANWMPFYEHAKAKPFFVILDEDNYPDEGAFCWVDKDSEMPSPVSNYTSFMSVSLKAKAKV